MVADMKRPGAGLGAWLGLLLTAPLVAVLFLGSRLVGLPFVPYDLFDWLTRKLPGGLVTIGIDSMVAAIRLLGIRDAAAAAKIAEQLMAVALAIAAGMILGALLFAVLRLFRRLNSTVAGLVVGAAAAVAVLFVSQSLGWRASVPPAAAAIWTAAVFLAWGASLGWAHGQWTRGPEAPIPVTEGSPAEIERVDRRRFIVRLGGAAATITVVGAAVGVVGGASRRREASAGRAWSEDHPLPNSGAEVEPAPGTRPELTPLASHYRIDINTTVPTVGEKSWRLKVGGLVERPVELTLAQIRGYEPLHQFVTLACISNLVGGSLIGTTRWSGVSLRRLLPDLAPKPEATHLKLSAADGFHEVLALETIRSDERVMLTYAWDGLPLAPKHGFPLRIYIPDLYGMKQPKWLTSIEALDHWEDGYWVRRGWDRTARMKATSVIDTISVNMMLSQADEKMRIPLGGVAHAGARGISRVEVRVDGGPWSEARLRTPLSGTTWAIWRYDWPFRPGNHTLAVRCFDGGGAEQSADLAPPHPSGAEGLHTKSVML
jgi:DMSO/TMAO reductase YedYZ molybdopterin-dependent catalytic subunit